MASMAQAAKANNVSKMAKWVGVNVPAFSTERPNGANNRRPMNSMKRAYVMPPPMAQ